MKYIDLYEKVDVAATNKKDEIQKVSKFKLKTSSTQALSRMYFSGLDIHASDLKKRNCIGKELTTGHYLVDMSIRDMKNY